MAGQDNQALFLLGRVAAALNNGEEPERQLSQALFLAGQVLGVARPGFFRKHYLSRDAFELRPMGLPEAEEADAPPPLPGEEQWQALRAGLKVDWQDDSGAPCLLAPAPLDKHLFGFLCLAGRSQDGLNQEEAHFLEAFLAVLALWVAKLDLDKKFGDLLDQIPIPTLVEDTEGLITAWNPPMAERTGWKAERIVGKGNYVHAVPFYYQRRPMASDLMLYPDPAWQAVYVDFNVAGDVGRGMSLCPNMPGGPIYFSFDAAFCYDLNNRLRGVIEFITDVTEEREVRRELRRSESLYRTVTDFAGVGIILFSRQKIIYMNRYVSELFGVAGTAGDLDSLREVIHPEDRKEVFACFDELFKNPYNPAQFEFRVRRGNRMHHYRGYAGMLDFEDQPTVHFIFDDITLQKDMAEKARLNELKLYHEDRLTSLGIMAAGIAHELNQPLNTIRVVTEGILFGMEAGWKTTGEELQQELAMVSRQVGRMSRVIQNIRDFSRDDSSVATEEVDINFAVENVFSMIGRQMEARGISVHKELSPENPRVEANLHRLEQVIMNLFVNARQALQDCGHATRGLWVKTRRANGQVTLEVADNATGVPEEIMDKIFHPFITTKEVGQGTGLGLSICKSITADYKGDITLFNNDQGGATFVVTLPARQ